MSPAKSGDTVVVHYTGKLDDGSVFDSSVESEPIAFQLGDDRVIPGFEEAIVGMSPGENKTATIASADAYGAHNPELVLDFTRDQLPAEISPEVGQSVQLQSESGEAVAAKIVDVSADSVKIDANHPLAGENLTFDIQLVEIR